MTKQREAGISAVIREKFKERGIFGFKVHGSALMMNGLPDLVFCVDGRFVGVETKVPEKRDNVSEVQKLVHQMIVDSGGEVLVVCGWREAVEKVEALRAKWLAAELPDLSSKAVRKLESLRKQREATAVNRVAHHRRQGEINGLDMAIKVLKGEL